jgi:hypothetical protein
MKNRILAILAAFMLALSIGTVSASTAQAYPGWTHCKTGDDIGDISTFRTKMCVTWEVDTSGNYVRPRQIQVTNAHSSGPDEMLGNGLTEYTEAGTRFYTDIDQLGTLYNGTITIDAYFNCGSWCPETQTWQSRSSRPVVKNHWGHYQNVRYGTVIWTNTTVVA